MEEEENQTEMKVVGDLDLARYMGRWYEIASFPSRFQPSDGVSTRATYALIPSSGDGTAAPVVSVLNETWVGGGTKRNFIKGTAFKADPTSSEGKLKARFLVPPFLPVFPVVGDYWVLYIDAEYRHALVGQPSRKYLWILCRETKMEEEVYELMVEKARAVGYDVSKLRRTTQLDPPPESAEGTGFWWLKGLLFGK